MPQAIAYVVYTVGTAIGNVALAVAVADALIKLAILTAINMAPAFAPLPTLLELIPGETLYVNWTLDEPFTNNDFLRK